MSIGHALVNPTALSHDDSDLKVMIRVIELAKLADSERTNSSEGAPNFGLGDRCQTCFEVHDPIPLAPVRYGSRDESAEVNACARWTTN